MHLHPIFSWPEIIEKDTDKIHELTERHSFTLLTTKQLYI